IDIEDNALHFVAFVNHFAGMTHCPNPTHVADMQQAVDAFFDLDESAVTGEIANDAANDRTGRIALGHFIPGVGLNLFHCLHLRVIAALWPGEFLLTAQGQAFLYQTSSITCDLVGTTSHSSLFLLY